LKIILQIGVLIGALTAITVPCRAQSVTSAEGNLWKVWSTVTNRAMESSAVIAVCNEFEAGSPQNPLALVVTGIKAWHLLKIGNTNEAVVIFKSMLTVNKNATAIQLAGVEMAKSWLTRLDHEKVMVALKKLYLRDIEFPATLEAIKSLKNNPMPLFTDRWGKPWVYRLGSSINGMDTQRYILKSSSLGVDSDLEKALNLSYGEKIKLAPVRLVPGGNAMFEFTTGTGKSAYLQLGGKAGQITVVYLGVNLIIMADENHWRVVLKPRN